MIINSLLDNDLYKFFTHWYALKYGENDEVEFSFINRGKIKFTQVMTNEIEREINCLVRLIQIRESELEYLRSLDLFPEQYLTYLKNFKFERTDNQIDIDNKNGDLSIKITGWWHDCTLLEVPIMGIISEVYNKHTATEPEGIILLKAQKIAKEKKRKLDSLMNINYSEIGTRRRYSYGVQLMVNQILECPTSNLKIGMDLKRQVVGTQPHELYMYQATKRGYHTAYLIAASKWNETFDRKSKYLLTDTFTSKAFFEMYKSSFAWSWEGGYNFRQDSGDPIGYIELTNKYLEETPREIIFSDGLDVDKVADIRGYITDKGYSWITPKFGIGTNLTNDIPRVEPLNIVIKLTKVNGKPTIKLSDSPGKSMGPEEEINRCKKELEINPI